MEQIQIIAGGMLMSYGVCAWAFANHHPEKISPRLGRKIFKSICFIAIVCGLIEAFGRIIVAS